MRTNNLIRKTLIAAGLMTALSAAPFALVAAQSAAPQPQAQDTAMQQPMPDPGMQDKSSSNRTVPGKTDDAWITTKVKSELATTKGITSGDISVSTKDGLVSLTGTASSSVEKAKVEQVAKRVKGVKSIDASGLTISDTAK